jgi:hypothetical protein
MDHGWDLTGRSITCTAITVIFVGKRDRGSPWELAGTVHVMLTHRVNIEEASLVSEQKEVKALHIAFSSRSMASYR